jgi:hypothetical protein
MPASHIALRQGERITTSECVGCDTSSQVEGLADAVVLCGFFQVWMVHPNIRPPELVKESDSAAGAPRPPRVEYLATLSRHSAAVNVVRFSPNGGCLVSSR